MRRGVSKCRCTNRCVLASVLFFVSVNAVLFVWLDVGNASYNNNSSVDQDDVDDVGDVIGSNGRGERVGGLFAGIGRWLAGGRRHLKCPHDHQHVTCPPCQLGNKEDLADGATKPKGIIGQPPLDGRGIESHGRGILKEPGDSRRKNGLLRGLRAGDANAIDLISKSKRLERDIDDKVPLVNDKSINNHKLANKNKNPPPRPNLHNSLDLLPNGIEENQKDNAVVDPLPVGNEDNKPEDPRPPNNIISPPRHHLCILIPYRDRFEELLESLPHLNSFLSNQSLSFRTQQPVATDRDEGEEQVEEDGGGPYSFDIIVLNQVDLLRFNRASLINVGYFEAQRLGCDYFAMHDVDLLPLNPLLNYAHPGRLPYHVASPEYHPRYHYDKFIGGILIVTMAQFRRVNGMSNRYWGWGLEDDEFYVRLKEADLVPRRPTGLTTGQRSTFYHIHNPKQRPRDAARLYDQKKVSRRRDRVTGLDSLQFSVRARYNITVNQASAVVVEVELTCDLDYTPWCQFPSAAALVDDRGGQPQPQQPLQPKPPHRRPPRQRKPYEPKFVDE